LDGFQINLLSGLRFIFGATGFILCKGDIKKLDITVLEYQQFKSITISFDRKDWLLIKSLITIRLLHDRATGSAKVVG
jgi:hypothetical protein